MNDDEAMTDQAVRYVLGEMPPGQRGDFEARLSGDAALRALVRELEEGVMAAALAAPRRPAPQDSWRDIQAALDEETRPVALWSRRGWWPSRWAVAACLAGLTLMVFWGRFQPRIEDSPARGGGDGALAANAATEASGPADGFGEEHTSTAPLSADATPLVTEQEARIEAMRQRIHRLEEQLAGLAEALVRAPTIPEDNLSVSFFQLRPLDWAEDGEDEARVPSPELHQALLRALGQEMAAGGAPVPIRTNPDTAPLLAEESASRTPGVTATEPPVEVVELPTPTPGTNHVAHPVIAAAATEFQGLSANLAFSDTAGGNSLRAGIPGLIHAGNTFLAVDASVVPAGTDRVTVHFISWGGTTQLIGSVWLGTDPVVLKIPTGHAGFVLSAETLTGLSAPTIIGVFPGSGQAP